MHYRFAHRTRHTSTIGPTSLEPVTTVAETTTLPAPVSSQPAETTTVTTIVTPPETTAVITDCAFNYDAKEISKRFTTFVALSNLVGSVVSTGDHDAARECY